MLLVITQKSKLAGPIRSTGPSLHHQLHLFLYVFDIHILDAQNLSHDAVNVVCLGLEFLDLFSD